MLEHLYAITKLLANFDSVERTVSSALAVAAEALPLRTAILIEETGDGSRTMVVWHTEGTAADHLERARTHAQAAYGYLVGVVADPSERPTATALLPGPQREQGLEPGEAERFITLPLVVGRNPVFGVLQLEAAAPLVTSDLAFASGVTNQLAVALDRLRAWERDIAARERAEGLARKYETLVDNLDHAFVWQVHARTLEVCYVSARVETLLGYPRQRWLDEQWREHVLPEDWDAIRSTLERALAEGKDQRIDHRWIASDGRVLWFHTAVHLAVADPDNPLLQGVSIDMTATKEAEERVREQLDFTKAMAASLGEGVIAVDLRGRVTVFNRAAAELLGWTEQEVLGQELERFLRFPVPEGSSGELALQRAIDTGTTMRSDKGSLVRRDRAPFPVRYVAAPIRKEGKVAGAVLAFEDITQRRRSEEVQRFLLEASRLLSSSLDRAAVLKDLARLTVPRLGDLCLIDVVARDDTFQRVACVHVDPARQAALDEALGRLPRATPADHPVIEAIRTGGSQLAPDVEEGWLRASAATPEDLQRLRGLDVRSVLTVPMVQGDRRVGALTFCVTGSSGRRHDSFDLVVAEELARRTAFAVENGGLFEEAQRAARAREQVLGIVSHDLRSPLGTVLMSTDLLVKAAPVTDTRLRAGLERTQRAAQQMKRLIEDLLDAVSVQSGHLSVHKEPNDPTALMTEVAASFEPTAAAANLRLVLELEPSLPQVPCDRARIVQVLSNLISNAMKVTPASGTVTLRARARGHEIVFEVADTGPGIAQDQLVSMFERFWRGPQAGYQGTGLGLAICRGLVDAHGGRIWAESTPGRGATLSFTLPILEGAGHST